MASAAASLVALSFKARTVSLAAKPTHPIYPKKSANWDSCETAFCPRQFRRLLLHAIDAYFNEKDVQARLQELV